MIKSLFTLLLVYTIVNASSEDELSMLSLEELLDVPVTSTSRRAESQHLAPGLVTIVSSQEMTRYGARHLRDVIDRVVGTQVLGSHQDYHSKTSMRGVNSSHHEGQVLILINGRPIRQATDGGLNSDLYLGFPLSIIDHLEVVRGPGSVIYGSNAVTGVINIVTKDGKKSINETTIDLGAGSFARKQVELSTVAGGKDYNIVWGLNYIKSNGDTVEDLTDADGNLGDYKTGQDSKNLVFAGSYKNLSFNGIAMDNLLDSASSTFQFPAQQIDLKRYYFDIGYKQDLTKGWDLSFNYTVNVDSADWQISEANGVNRSDAQSDMFEMILRGNVKENLNILLGSAYVRNESGFLKGLPQESIVSYKTIYTQLDYLFSPTQKLIAGLQFNQPRVAESDYSPRAGFVQGFNENNWLKLLYSEAYRSPTLVETDIDAPALQGNPLLDPEKIATSDIQFIHKSKTSYWTLGVYQSKLENLIVRVAGSPTTHANVGYVEMEGVEIEGRFTVSDTFDIIGNFSHHTSETNTGETQSLFSPEVMAKLGFSYSGIKATTISVFNSYIGESTDLNSTVDIASTAPAINPKAEAYNLLTANIIIDTAKLFNSGKPGISTLSIYLDNLLDEKIYAPDLNYANANNTIPHHWGRGAYVSYSYKFR